MFVTKLDIIIYLCKFVEQIFFFFLFGGSSWCCVIAIKIDWSKDEKGFGYLRTMGHNFVFFLKQWGKYFLKPVKILWTGIVWRLKLFNLQFSVSFLIPRQVSFWQTTLQRCSWCVLKPQSAEWTPPSWLQVMTCDASGWEAGDWGLQEEERFNAWIPTYHFGPYLG